jgi:uncharacterized membrane protein
MGPIMEFDNKSAALAVAALAALIAAPIQAEAGPAPIPQFSYEKCYGIAAAGKNDCQTAIHSCAGEAKTARDPASWIYVPVGTCAKISGGSLKSS